MTQGFTSTRNVLIEWGHCDPADIVFYPNYFKWFDASTANHFHQAGLPKADMRKRFGIVGYPMVDTRATFHIPSRFGDEVTIETTFPRLGNSSFDIHHRLLKGDKLAVEGFETRVLVRKKDDGSGLQSCPIPEEIRARLTQPAP